MGRRSLAGSAIGGIAETQAMLDFCGAHNITADVEVIPIQRVNEAYERLLKSHVRYRFSIDMVRVNESAREEQHCELATAMFFGIVPKDAERAAREAAECALFSRDLLEKLH